MKCPNCNKLTDVVRFDFRGMHCDDDDCITPMEWLEMSEYSLDDVINMVRPNPPIDQD